VHRRDRFEPGHVVVVSERTDVGGVDVRVRIAIGHVLERGH
jgi:hypothetical protein